MGLLLFLLSVQNPNSDSAKADFQTLGLQWIENARLRGEVIDPVDSLVLLETLGDFGLYLDETYGEEKRRLIFEKTETPDQFADALNQVTGLRFGSHYYDFYQWQEENSSSSKIWRETESDHFIYIYQSGSQAAQDINIIKQVAEKNFSDLITIIKPDSARLARLQRLTRSDGEEQSLSGKIAIRILPTRKDISGMDKILGGQTFFIPTELDGQVVYFLEVRLSYPGSAGLFCLPHQITHALENLFLTDEQALSEMLSTSSYLNATRVQSALPAQEFLRFEGFAYMFQYNYSSYVRLELWRNSKEMFTFMQELCGEIDIDELMSEQVDETFAEDILSLVGFSEVVKTRQQIKYEIACADLIRFLYDEYGSEKLRFFLANREKPQKAIEDVYGLSTDQLEDRWLNNLRE